jgi:hypothetical protein
MGRCEWRRRNERENGFQIHLNATVEGGEI